MSNSYKDLFPLIKNNENLIYLDSAATSQKPYTVIEALNEYYHKSNANPHRGAYGISIDSTNIYEAGRAKVKELLNLPSSHEVIFTKNNTEALNLVAYSYGLTFINEGDEIVVSITEHHSNLIPWQHVAKVKKATLKYLYINDNYKITQEEIDEKITSKTKLIAVGQASNVLGTINPIEAIIKKAQEVNAKVIVDGAQGVPHIKTDLSKYTPDFYTFSPHKIFGPMGIGVLCADKKLLDEMPPFMYGGDMVEYVYEQETTFDEVPHKFEAGTQHVEGVYGLTKAIDFINTIGYEKIHTYEQELLEYAHEKLNSLSYVKIIGPKEAHDKVGVVSFVVDDIHPHDLATILDSKGIALRAGNHCAQPLLRYLGVNATNRISLSIYNEKTDIDKLVDALNYARRLFGHGHE